MAFSCICTLYAGAILISICFSAANAGGYGKRKHLMKPIPESQRYHPRHEPAPFLEEKDLPKSLDWCDKNNGAFCTASWNQHIPHYCGSCYLHATLSMIADRIKIAKNGHLQDVLLGRQSFLNCGPPMGFSDGCDGGDVIDVLRYMSEFGLPDEGCMPYSATDYRQLGLTKAGEDADGFNTSKPRQQCPAKANCMNCMPSEEDDSQEDCWGIRSPVTYKLKSYGNVGLTHPDPSNMEAMMSEIYHRGPITCSIACPDDFVWNYDGGIYRDETGDTDVDHDVEVVGWGEEHGVKYWKVRNSWGQYWGVNGFFRVERGVNALQLEAGDCWYAVPSWEMEQEVEKGQLVGSMFGVQAKRGADAQSAPGGREAVQHAVAHDQQELQGARTVHVNKEQGEGGPEAGTEAGAGATGAAHQDSHLLLSKPVSTRSRKVGMASM